MGEEPSTVAQCLKSIGITCDSFSGCSSLQEEFSKIKKAYFKAVLKSHPDKGGDANVFRDQNTSFEVLRSLFDNEKVSSFVTSGSQDTADSYAEREEKGKDMPMPSWDFFANAEEESVPKYKVELAKSDRSSCKQKGAAKKCTADPPFIAKGEIRIGSMDSESGTYGRWCHLPCWRVPSLVWLGLPDPDICRDTAQFETALLSMNEVLLTGFSKLSPADRQKIVEYVMKKDNWARLQKRKDNSSNNSSNNSSSNSSSSENSSSSSSASSSNAVTVPRPPTNNFVVPVPGHKGALSNSLAGKTFVMTGLFPEVGGGTGLNLGKDKLKKMITAFGGRVTSAISGKTDILIVGKEPGYSKVSKARAKSSITLMSIRDLKEKVEGQYMIEDVPREPMVITSYSRGYMGNSVAPKPRQIGQVPMSEIGEEQSSTIFPAAPSKVATGKAKRATKVKVKVKKETKKETDGKGKGKGKGQQPPTRKRGSEHVDEKEENEQRRSQRQRVKREELRVVLQ